MAYTYAYQHISLMHTECTQSIISMYKCVHGGSIQATSQSSHIMSIQVHTCTVCEQYAQAYTSTPCKVYVITSLKHNSHLKGIFQPGSPFSLFVAVLIMWDSKFVLNTSVVEIWDFDPG